MKTKRRCLTFVIILFLWLLVSCGQLSSESIPTVTVPTQTPFPTYTPYPTYTPNPTFTPFVPIVPATLTIDEFQRTFIVYIPGNYILSKEDDPYVNGSPAAYDFVQVGEFIKPDDPYFKSQPPYFIGIQFHTLESLQSYYAYCDQLVLQGSTCFLNGDPELIKMYGGQKKAFENRENYEDHIIQKLGERFYFTKGLSCMGGFCELREYTTFFGNIKVVIYTLLYPNQTEMQSELSDKLFLSFYIEEAPKP